MERAPHKKLSAEIAPQQEDGVDKTTRLENPQTPIEQVEFAVEEFIQDTHSLPSFIDRFRKNGLAYILSGTIILPTLGALDGDTPGVSFTESGRQSMSVEQQSRFIKIKELAEKSGYHIEFNIANGNGTYVLHIGQYHNQPNKENLLNPNSTLTKAQQDLEQIILKVTEQENNRIIYDEASSVEKFDFAPIRERLAKISQINNNAERVTALNTYYAEVLAQGGPNWRRVELAQLNSLFARAVPEEISHSTLSLFRKDISNDSNATPESISYAAGAVSKLHAEGAVERLGIDDESKGLRAHQLTTEKMPEIVRKLTEIIEHSLSPIEKEEFVNILGHANVTMRFERLFNYLRNKPAIANSTQSLALLERLELDAREINAAIYKDREQLVVENIASHENGSRTFAPLVYGLAHNFTYQISSWNIANTENKLGLISMYPKNSIEFALRNSKKGDGY